MPIRRLLTMPVIGLCFLSVQVMAAMMMPTDFQTSLMSTTSCKCEMKSLEATPQDWVKGFNNLTDLFTELVGPTKNLTANNAFLVVAKEGPLPVILDRIVAAINGADAFLDQISDSKPIKKGKESDEVVEAYTASTKAANFWASILAGKSNSFTPGPAFKPIAALCESALRGTLEKFEELSFATTDFLEDRLGEVQDQARSLSQGFDTAINQYVLIKTGRA